MDRLHSFPFDDYTTEEICSKLKGTLSGLPEFDLSTIYYSVCYKQNTVC